MKAIYKIENLINHKIYVGQSNNPSRRWEEHIRGKDTRHSLIHEAIKKYGQQNFSFEVLEWTDKYDEREREYIQMYQSITPYGYNITPGGSAPPTFSGEKNNFAKISDETAKKVIAQLLDWRIPRKTIVANNHLTQDIVRHINDGTSWHQEELNYPLRPQEAVLDSLRAKYVQWLCCSSSIPLNQIGEKVGWGRSSAKMINQGNNHFDARLKYPIRNNKEYNKEILSQETCIDYLHFEE